MKQNAVVMEQTVNAPAINVENNVENVLANMEANTPAISLDLSFTAMNKALGAVFTETMKFKQAIRVFDGMGSLMVPISDKKKMKFADILGQVGVEYKAGRIDVESLKSAWKVFTVDGYMAIYRGVPGYEATEGDEKGRKVYTWDEKKSQYMGVSVQKIVAVEKWNARLILTGILQAAFTEKFEKQAKESLEAWDKFEGELYVFDKVTNKDGVNNKAKVIRKSQVEF